MAAARLTMTANAALRDRKSTRLNSSHGYISYAVFCLKKKKERDRPPFRSRRDHSAYVSALVQRGSSVRLDLLIIRCELSTVYTPATSGTALSLTDVG